MADPEVKEGSVEKKGGNPLLFIIIGVLVLIIAGGSVAFVMMMNKKTQPETEEQAKEEPQVEKKEGVIYEFEEALIVNLADTNAERFIKVQPVLEVDTDKAVESLNQKKAQVMDILINIFSSKSLEDVTSLSGKDHLKQEIVDKVNKILPEGKVLKVYFVEFVIQ